VGENFSQRIYPLVGPLVWTHENYRKHNAYTTRRK